MPAGSYALTAKAIDNQTATATSSGVQIQVITPTLTITSPATNASIPSDFVLVTGTYQAPANSGVTVNGVVASNDGLGNYFLNDLPLVPGQNTLTIVLTTADGQTVTQTQTVSSTATAPMQVSADPDAALAPATYTIRLENRTTNAYTNIVYQNLGGGQLDTSGIDQSTLGTITYTTPGIYAPRLVITDSLGNTYTQTVAIMVLDKPAVDGVLKSVWLDFTTALTTGDADLPATFLSSAAQVRYQPVFEQLAGVMSAVVASMEPPQAGLLDVEVAEYVVRRVQNGVRRLSSSIWSAMPRASGESTPCRTTVPTLIDVTVAAQRLVAIIALSGAMCSCGIYTANRSTARVVDADTGAPLEGVHVVALGK